jgi:hypothetical protein
MNTSCSKSVPASHERAQISHSAAAARFLDGAAGVS